MTMRTWPSAGVCPERKNLRVAGDLTLRFGRCTVNAHDSEVSFCHVPISALTGLPAVEPIMPRARPQRFNDLAGLFERKYDGFRGMLCLTRHAVCIRSAGIE